VAVGPVDEGLRSMIGLEVLFWRIWKVFVPMFRSAYPGAPEEEEEEVTVSLQGHVSGERASRGVARLKAGQPTFVFHQIQVEQEALEEAQSV
jgi:hypothetical protein